MMAPTWCRCCIILAIVLSQQVIHTNGLGVCFGMLGDNLPSGPEVVALYRNRNIQKMRLYNPEPSVLNALRGSGISVALGVYNEDLASLATNPDAALSWVNTNVVPYNGVEFQYITAGNEAIPGENARYIAPAMRNLRNALNSLGLNNIIVTTVVPSNVLGSSYPPSQGSFSNEVVGDMTQIVSFLAENPRHVLMVNVYPYFAYIENPKDISLDYALFNTKAPVVRDGALEYWYLFDAMVDAFYSAMEKVGGGNVGIAISESGWPSAGNGGYTTKELAQVYNGNFVNHIKNNGTPKRPNALMDGFVFAMFNEDRKPPGVEQNFGLLYPNGEPVYPFF